MKKNTLTQLDEIRLILKDGTDYGYSIFRKYLARFGPIYAVRVSNLLHIGEKKGLFVVSKKKDKNKKMRVYWRLK